MLCRIRIAGLITPVMQFHFMRRSETSTRPANQQGKPVVYRMYAIEITEINPCGLTEDSSN